MSDRHNDPDDHLGEVAGAGHTIEPVPTSITAFVGRARRGPVDTDEVAPVTLQSFDDFERIFGGLWPESNLGYAVRGFFLNGGKQAIVVRLHNGATAATLSLSTGAAPPNDRLRLVAASPGAWGNDLVVRVEHPTEVPSRTDLFDLTISETGRSPEKWPRLSINPEDADFAPRILERRSALVRGLRDERGAWLVPSRRPAEGSSEAEVDSGSDGLPLTGAQFTGAVRVYSGTGLYALEKVDLFNILCIPPYRSDGSVETAVLQDALRYCEKRRAMFLIDSPRAWQTAAQAEAGVQAMQADSSYGALYYPWIRIIDPLRGNRAVKIPPSGHVAGVYARTDAIRGVWKAPAGTEARLLDVCKLSVAGPAEKSEDLNRSRINCLRDLPGVGCLIWGARTVSSDPEWRYVPVRRVALFLEQSIDRGIQWTVFEPNDERLWQQIRLSIEAFMESLFRQGAFQGRSSDEAYFVRCGRDTTTENDIKLGIVNIEIGFAPLRPGEFVIIKIQQRTEYGEG